MKTRLIAALVLAAGTVAVAADEPNPYAKSKVGDYATYKMTTKVAGIPIEGTLTQTVATVTEGKEVSIAVSGKVNNQDLPPNIPEYKIDLTKPWDPTKASGPLPKDTEMTVDKVKEDKERIEKIKIAGKDYEAKVESYMLKVKAGGMEFPARLKVWHVKEFAVPMARMELAADFPESAGPAGAASVTQRLEVQMELLETGNRPIEKKEDKKDAKDPKKE